MKRQLFSPLQLMFGAAAFAGFSLSSVQAQQVTVLPREEINTFASNPAKLASFKKAVQVMKSRPASDPTSWAFQAAIHGKATANGQQDDSNPLYNQCQHAHWWFLPWHRAYLYYFERIVQKAAGDPTLRLPYWNYSLPNNAVLPAPYRDSSSPLFQPGRSLQTASDALPTADVNLTKAMNSKSFISSMFSAKFGGQSVNSPVQFGDGTGTLESLPHNVVHVDVGGLMQDPDTAALDPIFWAHHANIDRVWEAWLAQGGTKVNPTTNSAWMNAAFNLADENGQTVTITVAQVLNTAQLGYTYDVQAPPPIAIVANAQPSINAAAPGMGNNSPGAESVQPAIVTLAESSDGLKVATGDGGSTSAKATAATEGMHPLMAAAPSASSTKKRIILVLDGIEFEQPPGVTFDVYLNMPTANYKTGGQIRNCVGTFAFFESKRGPHGHAAHGAGAPHAAPAPRRKTFDITDLVTALKLENGWDPSKVDVTIVPHGTVVDGQPTKVEPASAMSVKKVQIVTVPDEEAATAANGNGPANQQVQPAAPADDMARAEKIVATQIPGAVLITAEGFKPSPGYKVYFEKSPLAIFPPQYILRQKKPTGMDIQVITEYRASTWFKAEQPVKDVTVIDAKGLHTITVEQAQD